MPKQSTTQELLGLGQNIQESEKDQEFTQRLADFRDTFSTPHGKRVLLYIISRTYQHDSAMTGNSATYYNLGAMDYGRSILDVVALADPETYLWIYSQHANDLGERYSGRLGDDAKTG